MLTLFLGELAFLEDVCLAAKNVPAPTNAETYSSQVREVCKEYGIDLPANAPTTEAALESACTSICCVTDDTPNLRRGMKDLNLTTLDIGCHAFQLGVNHIFPAPKKRRIAHASSEAGDEVEEESHADSIGAEDPDTVEMLTAVDKFMEGPRALADFYNADPEMYKLLEEAAKSVGCNVRPFKKERSRSWSSFSRV